ncbi:MAG TPA: arginine decarboxylase, partial [Spirochaetota bacterium]|nr:arginine decarboxylase [Spirochaetota bacterium]
MEKINWNLDVANTTYNISRWGIGYFFIDDEGFLCVSPEKKKEKSIRLIDIVDEAKKLGFNTPFQIRIQDLLRNRVVSLCEAFNNAIKESNYNSKYMGVFPIKVNQLREVVEEILDAGKGYDFGIEAGSKAELLASLSIHKDYDSFIICNGYKDNQYIRYALNGRKIGKKIVIVAEKLEELKMIVEMSKELNVIPLIGIRIKLATKSAGKWSTSSGDNAKFGLSIVDILEAIKILKENNLSDSFQLIHFHIGSQIPDIHIIKKAIREATRFYS